MTHYLIWPSHTGVAVCYLNHRGELVAVMDCATVEAAAREAAEMTARAFAQAQAATVQHQATLDPYPRIWRGRA